MGKPFNEGAGRAFRLRAHGQDIYRSGFPSEAAARKAQASILAELDQHGKAAGPGAHATTARYLVRCVGVRAHAFRHIVATSILKADGGDYKTAALVLNDRPATVERHYAWLHSMDGSERMAELLGNLFKRM